MDEPFFDWNEIQRDEPGQNLSKISTERASVPGGWLVRILHYAYDGRVHGVGGLAFVPDPEHTWQV